MNMKQHIHHTLLGIALLSATVLSFSCSRNDEDRIRPTEQIPLSDFTLSFGVDDIEVYTKAGQSVRQENRVQGLYIMLFDEHGTLVRGKSYFVGAGERPTRYDDQITNYTEKDSETAGASMGVIERFFEGFSNYDALDNNMTFYAVANYNTTVEAQLKDIKTEDELQAMTITFTTAGNVFRTNFLMIAEQSGVAFNINTDSGQPSIDRIGVNLQLRRLDAKITFSVSLDIEDAENVAFDNMIYRVHNVPNVTYLFEQDKDKGSGTNTWDAAAVAQAAGGTGYSCMMDDTYDTFDTTYTDRVGGEFSFYLRETRPLPNKEITRSEQGNWSSLYAMREAWEGSSTDIKTPVHGRKFIYAPEYGTFVEISGNLSYTRTNADGETEEVYGDVTYIVHLGETGNDANNQEAVNNYDVRRNVRYIYNVRITGVNNMEVEVYEQTEERPGAEGDLIISTNRQYSLDAHYGRVLLELDKRNLEQAGWSAVTPLGTIEYDPETGLINAPYDYKWVLFAINRHFDRDNDGHSMVKFPGIQAYDGGIKFFENGSQISEDQIREAVQNDYGNNLDGNGLTFKEYVSNSDHNNYYYRSASNDELDDDACLMDINQLINYLKREMTENPKSYIFDGNIVYITAFVDEFTYLYDPREEDYIHPGESAHGHDGDADARLALWKEYTNVGNRTLNILPMRNINYSPDHNTSITNAYITLTQNSIKTIETTNETQKLPHYLGYHGNVGNRSNTKDDGRTNFINFWINGSTNNEGSIMWDDVMTLTSRIENSNSLSSDYRDALHACITRNRDLNGNNRIDKNEIFWYLAAKSQLDGLWIGQPALEQSAWMYQGNGDTVNHLMTSSYFTEGSSFSSNNFWVLWAEEGTAWGQIRDENGDGKYPNRYDYRCIRNLGIDISNAKAPTHYASYDGPHYSGNNRYYTVTLDAVNNRVLRTSQDDGINLPLDDERSQNNRPYRKFDVLLDENNNIYTTPRAIYTWPEMRDALNGNENPCPQGWRVPNQREYLIMMNTIDAIDWTTKYVNNNYDKIGIATSFSFNGVESDKTESQGGTNYSSGKRYGFAHSGKNVYLYNPNDGAMYFRCVRDHTGN